MMAAIGAAAGATAVPACLLAPGQAESLIEGPSCVWESPLAVDGDFFRVSGSRNSLEETATPTVVASAPPLPSTAGAPGKLHA
jgi:hypothetical protein